MNKEYKIFEGNTLQEGMNKLLIENFMPLNLKETWDYKQKNKLNCRFNTASIFINGEIRDITRKEMGALKAELYDKGGRMIVLYNMDDNTDVFGYYILFDNSRFVGVKKQKE